MELTRVLVVGLAVTGQAVTRALRSHGTEVVVVDDHPSESTRAAAESLGVEIVESPTPEQVVDLVGSVDAVLPSPGVPDRHMVFEAARDRAVPVLSEFDLAADWDSRPIVAITGTDGKTTVTTLVTSMFEESGRRAVAAGNTDVPLVVAIEDPAAEVFVVEASSFRLGHTRHFRPTVATWLNFAPDHLDVHASIGAYEAAKARIWAELPGGATAIANADDPIVLRNVVEENRTVTFGLGAADFTVDGDVLRTADGEPIVAVDEMWRALPHDVANALAASASALAGGATLEGVRIALRGFTGLPHRVELIADVGGMRFYDDSKATAPHATLAAVEGFESVVLIAGGHNKGLDLAPLGALVPLVRGVVAMGESAEEVAAVFEGRCPLRVVTTTMDEVVASAVELAEPGDVVLLSPGCASFDWFSSYSERGDAFRRAVETWASIHQSSRS